MPNDNFNLNDMDSLIPKENPILLEDEDPIPNAFLDPVIEKIVDEVVGATKDYITETEFEGQKLTKEFQQATNAGVEYNDDFQVKNESLTDAQQQFVDRVDEQMFQTRMTATKDPVFLGANIAARWSAAPLLIASVAYGLNDYDKARKADENLKKQGQEGNNANNMAYTTGITTTSAIVIPKALQRATSMSKFLTPFSLWANRPLFASSMALSSAYLFGGDESREYMKDHWVRTGYNFYAADIAGLKIRGNNNKTKGTPHDTSGASPVVGANQAPSETVGNNREWQTGIVFADKKVTESRPGMVEPTKTNKKPEALNEKAFAGNTPEQNARVDSLANNLANDILEAKQHEPLGDGIFDDGRFIPKGKRKLTFSAENLYGKPVSVDEIWKTAQAITPALPSRVDADASTLGYYSPFTEQIRVRGFKSWSTLCHEIGHSLSKKLQWGTSNEQVMVSQQDYLQPGNNGGYSSVTSELKQAALSIWKNGEYGNPNTPDGHLTYIEEGRAAFMNEYLINPERAKADLPLTYADFEAKLALDPTLKKQVELLGQQVRQWGNSSPYQQVNSTVTYANKDFVPMSKKISNALLKVETATIDELAPLRKIVSDFLMDHHDTVVDPNTGAIQLDSNGLPLKQKKTLKFENNPANIAQRAKEGINASVNVLIGDSGLDTPVAIQAVSDKYGVSLNNTTLKDAFSPLRDYMKTAEGKAWCKEHGITNEQGMYEGFTSYMLAKHEAEVIGVQNAKRLEVLKSDIKKVETQIKELTHKLSQTTKSTPEGETLTNKYKQNIETLNTKLANLQKQVTDINMGRDDYMTTMPRKELEKVIADGDKTLPFVTASELFHDWNENVLRIAVKGGLISAEDANYFLNTYPNYIPMKRSFAVEGNMGVNGSGADTKYANITGVIHALSKEGTDRTIKDPFVQSALNLQSVISKVERNKVAQAVVDLSKQEGGANLLTPVKGGGAAEQVISVWENGKEVKYQCNTPGLYEALSTANQATQMFQLNAIESVLQGTAQTLRRSATSTWTFAARNMVKDLLNASILNKDGRKTYLPVIDQALLLWDGFMARADKKLMAEYKTQGVQYTTYIGSGEKINFNLRDYVEGNPHHMKTVWDKITSVADVGEQLPRLALYKRARERGVSPFEAACIASDGTTNFMRSGSQVKQINRYIPFFNAVIQGNNKVFRAIKSDPVGVGLVAMTYLTLPSLICWSRNHDKDWYRDMPLDKKNKNWYWDFSAAQDGSAVLALPKNEILGYFFGSIPERILDFAVDNDRDGGMLKETFSSTLLQAVPSGFPTALLPIIEWMSNYSFFRDKPIVDMRNSKVKDEDQYTPYTSEAAKRLGKATGLSPLKIDNTIYDLTSTFGYAATGAIDMIARDTERPSRKPTEWTSLTYTPGTATTRSADVFYKGLDRLEKEHGSEVKRNAKNNKGKKKKIKTPKDLKGLRDAKKEADDISLQITELEGAEMSGDTKRVERDKLVKERNNIYRKANRKYLGYKYIQSPQ